MATPFSPGAARASITVDTSALQSAATVARTAGQAVSRELQATMKAAQNEQRLAIIGAQQAATQVRAQEQRQTAITRAESQQRVQLARAQAAQTTQLARANAASVIEQERRVTAQYRTELRAREAAARQAARVTGGGGGLGGAIAGGLGRFAMGAVAPLAAAVGGAALVRGGFEAGREAAFAERSAVAFDKLSGSAAIAAERLRAVDAGANGALSRLEAMRVGVQAAALGLAETSEEFGRLASAARAVTFVSPVITDIGSAITEIALASANLSFRRLDQLGLGVNEVKARMEELRKTQRGLNENQIFAAAVIDTLNTKYADLIKTSGDAASSFEQAAAKAADARVKIGEVVQPAAIEAVRIYTNALIALADALQLVGSLSLGSAQTGNEAFLNLGRFAQARRLNYQSRGPNLASVSAAVERNRPAAGRTFDEDQTAAIRDWADGVQAIERSANSARLDATRSHEQQRSQAIEQFALANVREEEDFQRSRFRAAQNLARSIARVGAEAAEREAEMVEDRDRRIGKIRAESEKRIAEQERDFAKERERAQRDHRDKLMDAAARLDAAAVFEEQRRFSREEADAQDDHREAMSKERRQLAERIDQENDAHQERLNEARKADAKRIAEMRESLAESQRIEDEDRAIRQQRQAEDHARQLSEMARAQAERLAQINRQAAEQRTAHNEAFQRRMLDLGVENERLRVVMEARERLAIKAAERFFDAIEKRLTELRAPSRLGPRGADGPTLSEFARGGFVRRTEPALVHRGEFVLSREMVAAAMRPTMPFADGRGAQGGVTFRGDVHVSIAGGTNMERGEMYAVAREAFVDALTQLSEGAG